MRNVHVTTSDLSGDLPREHVVIDHDDAEHRTWLGKHCFWAMRNNRQVCTFPTEAPVTFKSSHRTE